ncbi:SAM-dependent methyltransferase [Frankia sp. AiPs1]|uniref:SAM-dependent methyltransferase n=1 Tax=Frankia sp. AiPs1 TaxID=573493 RepID=UPI0027E2CD22|nr:SAM-dependent methyltransferase [Frankia sp. AiPs1]
MWCAVTLSLIAIFHLLPDDGDPYGIVRRLVDALPSGSYLVLSHGTADFDPGAKELAAAYRQRGLPLRPRTHAEVERLFDGLELVDSGLVVAHR